MKFFGKLDIKKAAIVLLAAACVFLYIDGCVKGKRLDEATSELSIANLKNQELDSIKNKLDQTVYTQEAVIVRTNEALKSLTDEKFQLHKKHEKKIKEVTFYYESKLKIKADSVFIPFPVEVDNLDHIKNIDSLKAYVKDSTIRVPKTVSLDSSYSEYKKGLRLSASVNKEGLKINTVGFVDTQYIRVNKLKRNLWQSITFKPRKFEVQVLHTSPYVTVEGQNSVIYVDKKRGKVILDLLKVGAGVFIGNKIL